MILFFYFFTLILPHNSFILNLVTFIIFFLFPFISNIAIYKNLHLLSSINSIVIFYHIMFLFILYHLLSVFFTSLIMLFNFLIFHYLSIIIYYIFTSIQIILFSFLPIINYLLKVQHNSMYNFLNLLPFILISYSFFYIIIHLTSNYFVILFLNSFFIIIY